MRGMFTMNIYRLLIALVALSVTLIMATQFALYHMFYRSMVATSQAYLDDSLQVMKGQIEAQLETVSSSLEQTAYSENVLYFLSASPEQKFGMYKLIAPLFQSMRIGSPIVRNIHIRKTNGTYLTSGAFGNYEYMPNMVAQMLRDHDISEPFSTSFFTSVYAGETAKNAYFAYWVPLYIVDADAKRIAKDDRYFGACIAICDVQALVMASMQHHPEEDYTPIIMLMDGSTPIYSTSSDPEVNAVIQARNPHGQGYQIRSARIEPVGWEIRYAVSDTVLLQGIKSIQRLTVLMMIVVAIVQLYVGVTLYQSIARPLASITTQLSGINRDTPDTRLTVQSQNEIGIISREINQMLDRISEIGNQVLAMQSAVHKAEMENMRAHILYLQMQINPHFLYNNLECVRGMIARHGASAREMVTSMAAIYRYCASPNLIVTIRHEVDSCREFAHMMALRYGERFVIRIDVSDAVLDRPCAKMTLQPLLENCILHGYRNSRDVGVIALHCIKFDEYGTLLSVTDDGVGMPPEQIEAFNQGHGQSHAEGSLYHLGMKNVDERIRLMFGEAYGLRLKQGAPKGLTVEVYLGAQVQNTV